MYSESSIFYILLVVTTVGLTIKQKEKKLVFLLSFDIFLQFSICNSALHARYVSVKAAKLNK
jgi:hypothetical protein